MSRIISKIQNNFTLDSLRYLPGFKYEESIYANMDFPEVGNIDLFDIVSPPAKNSSTQTLNEIKKISSLTKNRSKQELKLVYEVDTDPLLLFLPLIEDLKLDFDRGLFSKVYYYCVSAIIDHLKHYYNRARPFQVADLLQVKINRIITKTHHTPSYPSGHTMYAALIGEFLIDKHPEHQSKIDAVTERTGLGRVLQGVHYPSDNEASIKIIKTIFPNLKKYFSGE